MFGIFLSALILMGTLWLVARHDAEINFLRMLLISLGITVVSLLAIPLGFFSLPIIIAALAWALVQFCYVSWTQAWVVTGVYIAAQIGLSLLLR